MTIDQAGPLWCDGRRVPRRVLRERAAIIRDGLRGLPLHTVIRSPSDPVTDLVTRVVAADLGLAVALGAQTARLAGVAAAAVVSDDGTVHRYPGTGPSQVPGAARLAATSGSSGRPEAVAHDAAAIAAQARALRDRLELDRGDRMLLPLPVAHAYGASVAELWARYGVGLLLEVADPVSTLAPRICATAPTSVDLVPTMLAALLGSASRDDRVREALAGIRLVNVGGDVLPAGLARRASERFDVLVLDGYGLTEAGPNVAVSSPRHHRAGTVGPPLDGVEIRIGAGSQISVRGPGVMRGYVRDGVVIPKSDAEGWLATGDTGSVDADGFLAVVGRAKETILIHGRTFAPAQVEDLLRSVPGVGDAGVLGHRPDGVFRDRVVAFVAPAEPRLPEDRLRAACAAAVPGPLKPVQVRLLDRMPLLANGKIDRAALRRLVA